MAEQHTLAPVAPVRHAMLVRVHVLLHRGEDVLFTRRDVSLPSGGCWQLPGGHVEPGESVLDTAVREVEEEVALRVPREAMRFLRVVNHRTAHSGERIAFFFETDRWDGEAANAEPHLCSDMRWAPLTDAGLPMPLVPYIAAALNETDRQQPLTLFGWF